MLSILFLFPLVCSIIAFAIKNKKICFLFSLSSSVINCIMAVLVYLKFDNTSSQLQLVENYENIAFGLYNIGVDGTSILFVLLSVFLVPFCIIASYSQINDRYSSFTSLFLMLESFAVGVFCSNDVILFYIFFEAVLIPMYFIIGIWGGKNRIYSAYKFFIYTFAGSVFFLLAIIYLSTKFGSTDITQIKISCKELDLNTQIIIFLALFLSLAIKVPMFPFHTWLPDAHVEAPTAGSVYLAGILIKIGGYGMIRFLLGFTPLASQFFSHFIIILSIIAIVYTSILAIKQPDIKKMIAYSSVAHMAFVTTGIFTLSKDGISAAIFQMISHGIISGALFLSIGVIYDRLHTREFTNFGGIATSMPNFAMSLMVLTMGSVGLPGTSGFVGEFMSIISVYNVSVWYAILVGTGVIFGACYMLYMYKITMFGKQTEKTKTMTDITLSEKINLYSLSVASIAIGIYPNIILKTAKLIVI